MRFPKRWFFVPLVFLAVVIAVVLLVNFSRKNSILAARMNLLTVSRQYPKFTMEQRMAVLRESQSERHPLWRDLSLTEIARRLMKMATAETTSSLQPPLAPFLGNTTVIASPGGTALGLVRQSNCTLTMLWATYTLNLSLPSANYDISSPTTNYSQVLHNEAGLTTTGGLWPEGCVDSNLGIASSSVVPLGLTSGSQSAWAAAGYDGATGNQVIWSAVVGLTGGTTVPIGDLTLSNSSPVAVAAADLNGDGIADLVSVNDTLSAGGSASLAVLLGNADGSLKSPVTYTLPGETGISVVIDDFNGDGIPDLVASSSSSSSGTTYSLTFLAGKGDGTFQTPQSVSVTPPSGFGNFNGSDPYFGLISADLLGSGKKDLVTSAGIVLLGNGNGSFNQSSTLAFPTPTATSEWGPNVIAADLNNDGKLDLAVDNGLTISIYLGNGTGTFTAKGSYASIGNTGVLSAADLDGDGNIDLYSGTARAGFFSGDRFDYNQAYALMSNGNGTFQGAPEVPFVLTGTNLAKLTSSPNMDAVGVTANSSTSTVSMVSYLGNGSGAFTAGPTLQVSPVMIQGKSYSFDSLDSFGLGDITGDGQVDLAYLAEAGSEFGPQVGYFLATGNGDGSFNAPTFIAAPLFAPSGDVDQGETLSNLFVRDVNGDGKADLVYSYSLQVYTTGVYEQGIAIQLSNGDGTFQAPQVIQTYSSTISPSGTPPQVVYIGDATGSGKLDLVTMTTAQSVAGGTGVTTYQLQLYLGNGDGSFGSALTLPVADNVNPPYGGTVTGQIALADMNGDGKPDLITLGTTNNGENAELAIALGNGDGTFQTPTIIDFGDGSSLGYGLAVADFNGDGKLDVAVAGFNPGVDTGVFLGNGDGTVQTSTAASGGLAPSESIGLLVDGTAQAVNLSGGTGLPDLIAGGVVLVNQASTTPILTSTTTTLTSSASGIAAGQSVTFTATVSASGSTPAGSVTFSNGSTMLGTETLNGSGIATYTTSSLSVGSYSITASYAGNSMFAASTSSATTVSVTAHALTASTTTLTASATTLTAGMSATFNVTVAPASGIGTPTGTVSFSSGTTTLAEIGLSNGAASYSTTSLPVGADSISAVYSGDMNFSDSTSNTVTVTVQELVPSFTLGASPTSGTVTAGATAQTTITVTPVNGFNSQVSFACSGLPTGATCSFSPSTVMPGGSAVSSTLSIVTTAQSAAHAPLMRPAPRSGLQDGPTLAFLAGGGLWLFRRRKNLRWPLVLVLIVGWLEFATILSGCGGYKSNLSSQSQSATATVTVTASAGSETQKATYTLKIQQ